MAEFEHSRSKSRLGMLCMGNLSISAHLRCANKMNARNVNFVCCKSTKCESGSSIMTRVLHRTTEGHTLRVRMHACAICHACNAHLRCANQGIVRILLLPGANAPSVHKSRSPSMAKRTLMMTFMACKGSKVKLWGSRGQTQHDRHSVPYLAQRSKVKKCARTRPALTTDGTLEVTTPNGA